MVRTHYPLLKQNEYEFNYYFDRDPGCWYTSMGGEYPDTNGRYNKQDIECGGCNCIDYLVIERI